MFVVCYNRGTRQTLNFAVCFYFSRVFIGGAHDIRACLPCVYPLPCVRKPGTRQTWALPCVAFSAHGKGYVCRVPDMWHTAKLPAHGNQRVSGSACPFLVYQHLSLRYIGGAIKLDRSLILLWLWRASFMIAFTRSFQKGSTPSYIKRLHEKARETKIKVYIK